MTLLVDPSPDGSPADTAAAPPDEQTAGAVAPDASPDTADPGAPAAPLEDPGAAAQVSAVVARGKGTYACLRCVVEL